METGNGQKVEIWRWSKFADSQNEEDSGLPPQAGGGAMQTRGMPSPQNCGWGSCLLSTKLLGSPLGKTGQAMEPCHVCHGNQIS